MRDDPLPPRRLDVLADGTVQQQSPVTGTVVWTVPGRSNRPLRPALTAHRPLDPAARTTACAFCSDRYLETPPEKARLLVAPDDPRRWRIAQDLTAEQVCAEVADFRRFPNLFEILQFSYWQANHDVQVPSDRAERARAYLATPMGRAHVGRILRTRLLAAGWSDDQISAESDEAQFARALGLFVSTHDLIVPRRHFVDAATHDDELCSTGDLTPDEHHAFLAFTLAALRDLASANPYVRYVSVFQNWLAPAGASFDHLHKQLVAIDELGPMTSPLALALRRQPDLFNREVADPAIADGLVIAGNDHALALAGVGHRYPTIEIYSTSHHLLPWEHDPSEVRALSDLLHACHAATGRMVPSNEEWHYRPPELPVAMPWRINLKWRISTLAGFEGGTRINVNTISPFILRDRVVASLQHLRDEGRIATFAIGDECTPDPGPLHYADI